ncbi:hypothetical protein BH11MYX1_BH11MYX1_33350 [soil metagenome]
MRTLVLALLLAGCSSGPGPSPTGTTCADPDPITGTTTLTYDNFGKPFMDAYCINCHSSDLPHSQRNGAPIYHDFDTLLGVLEVPDHIDEQTGHGPKAQNNFMPGDGTGGRCPSVKGGTLDEACPEPTAQERTNLAVWIACERERTHNFIDGGVGSANAN